MSLICVSEIKKQTKKTEDKEMRDPVDQAEIDNDQEFEASAEDRFDYNETVLRERHFDDMRDDEFMAALELNLKKPDYAGDLFKALRP
jgi:hypothetical protein